MAFHIVVGAGSAGCLVARTLSDAGHQVVLLEAGPGDPPPAIRSPNWLGALDAPGWSWAGLQAKRPDGFAHYWRGRGLGGSSAINGLVALEGLVADYVPWLGDHADVEAIIEQIVKHIEPQTVPLGPLAFALGATPAPLTLRDGYRYSSADAYLAGAGERLTVRADCAVDQIDLVGQVVRGVVLGDGTTIRSDSVWVCAGAVHSPLLLLRSGVETPGIGHGLQDHIANRFVVTLPEEHQVDDPTNTPPVTGLLTLSSGIVDPVLGRAVADDTQILVMDHVGQPGQAMVLGAVMQIESRGVVTLGVDDQAVVDANVLDAEVDRQRLAWISAEVERRLDRVDLTHEPAGFGDYVHATSTCPVGSVVDSAGRVGGYRGLRVVDASVFPHIPRVNTHLPTLVAAAGMTRRALAE